MDKKRFQYYKKKLVQRREDLLRAIARTEQEGREADEDPTVDLADKAANSYTKEFLFGQTHNDRSLLQLVDKALERIREGNTASARSAMKSCSKSAWRRFPGRATASPVRKTQNRTAVKPQANLFAKVYQRILRRQQVCKEMSGCVERRFSNPRSLCQALPPRHLWLPKPPESE